MATVLFIVWRESLEAVLVVGILYAYLTRLGTGRRGMRYLFTGVAGGIGLSALLALVTMRIETDLQGQALQYFQVAMMATAATLLTQMVLWMHRHGRRLKHDLEANLDRALSTGNLAGIGVVALLAVAREGAETVLYLYGLGMETHSAGPAAMTGAAVTGFALALATAWLVSRGVRFLNYRTFFRITGVVLLFTAAGMLVSAISQLIGMGVLPSLVDPVWNTSWILDANTRFGGVVAALTGYRPHPSLMLVLLYTAYWGFVVYRLRSTNAIPSPSAPDTATLGA
ncbi:MAG: hypothetical protein B7Z66_03465 [Chromatiales bacterium 21-64-14]|nr:MAG: hypothetical protein B7Z66_03465 [Chromatiales bacterium 21-64-14]HQU15802.1 FTR1 family protein [Gammaproteobacteria bacterium]